MTSARILITKFWKDKNDIKIEDWYCEVWDIALNDKLTIELKIKRGEISSNNFYDIWGKFVEFVLVKGRGKASKEYSIQFWRGSL